MRSQWFSGRRRMEGEREEEEEDGTGSSESQKEKNEGSHREREREERKTWRNESEKTENAFFVTKKKKGASRQKNEREKTRK